MKIYVITRFSIYDSYTKGFQKPAKIKKKGINYKNYLFSKSRLDSKFSLFEKITLPSVVNQTFDDWEWHIYTSIFLPENYKERLISICSKYEKIKLHFISSFKEFIFIKPNDNNYCTIRLDDDDGLNDTFFLSLQKYNHKNKCIISHSNGICFKIEIQKILRQIKVC